MREFRGRFSVRLASAITLITDTQRSLMTFSEPGFHPRAGPTPVPRVLSEIEKTAFFAAIDWMTREIRKRIDLNVYTMKEIRSLDLPQWLAAANIFTGAYRAATTEYDNSTNTAVSFDNEIPPVVAPRNMTEVEVNLYHVCLSLIIQAFEVDVPEYEFLTDSYQDYDDDYDADDYEEDDADD